MKSLYLRKCAYLFHWSANRFSYGTREAIERKHAINKAFEEYYYNPDKRSEPIPYTTAEDGAPVIEILPGIFERLNDLQIACIDDPDNLINHRKHIEIDNIIDDVPHFHKFCRDSLYSNKFKSFEFEFYTGLEDLGYIRVHFNGSYTTFVMDERSGDFYTAGEHGQHKPITTGEIINRLGIRSTAAITEFYEVIKAIRKGGEAK